MTAFPSRKLVLSFILAWPCARVLAQDAPAGIPDAPQNVRDMTGAWKDDQREKALDFDPGARPQRGLRASAVSNGPARKAKGAEAEGSAAESSTPPSAYRFRPEDLEAQPSFSFIASVKEGEPPVAVTCRDGVLYAGAQRYPIQGTTRIFVKKADGATLRRFIARRMEELRTKIPGAPAGARAVLQQELDALSKVRIIDLDVI